VTRTNAFGLLTVVIRALALWLALSAAFAIATAVGTGAAEEFGGVGLFLVVYGAVFGVAGLVWLFADVLARLTLASPTTPLFESEIAAAEWQRIAFSCIGLWVATRGVLDLSEHLLRWFISVRVYETRTDDLEPMFVPEIAVAVLHLGIGIALLFGARGLVALVARLRGREPVAPATDESAPLS
jgi:hypothetical protein